VTSDAEFILTNTDRLITVTIRCVISFGAADGLNDFLLAHKKINTKSGARQSGAFSATVF
jgi:queuine/archaeosine tRNA-ribosyltransferase